MLWNWSIAPWRHKLLLDGGCWMSPSVCLSAVLNIKVATAVGNGIPVILWAPRPYIHCTTLPRPCTDCTILHHVLSVHAHQASRWSLLVELLWVISCAWGTCAQPLVIYWLRYPALCLTSSRTWSQSLVTTSWATMGNFLCLRHRCPATSHIPWHACCNWILLVHSVASHSTELL